MFYMESGPLEQVDGRGEHPATPRVPARLPPRSRCRGSYMAALALPVMTASGGLWSWVSPS